MSRQHSRFGTDGPVPITRHGRLKRSRTLPGALKFLAAAMAVVLVSAVAVVGVAVWNLTDSVKPGVHLTPLAGQTAAPPQVGPISGAVNMLLVGSDTRTGQGGAFSSASELAGSSGAGNNDVTILIHIAANHQSAMVVSFPRDTEVPIPSCPNPKGGSYSAMSQQMLNSSLSYGGLACPVQTIEQLTGTTIPYGAEISFDGVAAMSNAVGGVTVCVASPIDDPDSGLDLGVGEHTIEGGEALAFLRTRHGVADGSDIGRISIQEGFLSSLVRKVKSGGVLSNPLQLYSLASAAIKNMQLSDTLENPDTLISIAAALKGIPLANVAMLQYPTLADPSNPNRLIPDPGPDAAVNAALLSDQPVKLTGTTGRGAELAPSAPTSTTPATPAPSGTATPAPSPSTTAPIQLPSTITGQTAAEQTCAKGNAAG
jgi:LCP family protein required for cell wall assembly